MKQLWPVTPQHHVLSAGSALFVCTEGAATWPENETGGCRGHPPDDHDRTGRPVIGSMSPGRTCHGRAVAEWPGGAGAHLLGCDQYCTSPAGTDPLPPGRPPDDGGGRDMSSLWTPGGERPVNPSPEPGDAAGAGRTSADPTGDPLRSAAASLGVDLDSLTDEEREKMTQLLDSGFTDTFRYLYPELTGAYTWWSFRSNARANNTGWRIDYFIVSDSLRGNIDKAFICPEITGSDHCPVGLELVW